MKQAFLEMVQSGNTAEVASAIESDPSLAQWRDEQNVSALLWAVYAGQCEMRDFLAAKLAALEIPLDVFEAAATGAELQLHAILSESACATYAYSGDGWTALHLAAAFGTPLSAATLIFRGAKVGAESQNMRRNQPLHAALALGKNTATIEILLAHGADVNATQASGFTAIFSAAMANRKDLAELLLAHGADPHHKSAAGKTPADFARERGHYELATWLDALVE